MSSFCWSCERGIAKEKHDCRKNHSGSSKSMESAAAVKLLANNKNFEEQNVECELLGTDGDASAFANVQAAVDNDIKKAEDVNHSVKAFKNALYKQKANGFSFLNNNVINYLKGCFRCAIQQNVDNVDGLREDLKNIVCHTFGEHGSCKDWCKAKGNPDYVYSHLPKRQPFTDANWRVALANVIDGFMLKAEKLAPNASTQCNESFNHMCVTKAPKARFYGGSNALNFRVAAAVCQKNEGSSHIMDVYVEAGLSPGKNTKESREVMENSRKRRHDHQKTEACKKRSLLNKFQSSKEESKKNKGVSYMSGMAHLMESAASGGNAT